MKIQDAIEIANDCGLETVGEAILNIKIHSPSLFTYSDIPKEIDELESTWNWIQTHRRIPDGTQSINDSTKIKLMLDYHIAEDLTDYNIYQQALKDKSFAKKLGEE